MKKLIFFLVLSVVSALMILPSASFAQVVRVDTDLFARKFLNSAADSVSNIQIVYEGITHPELKGVFPDSMRLAWYATGPSVGVDSVYVFLRTLFKYGAFVGAYLTRNLVDSIKARETDFVLIAHSQYASRDYARIVVTANAAGNALSTGAGNKVYLRLERYFTLKR